MFRCPDCGSDMKKRTIVTRLGDYDGWNCIACNSFYKKQGHKERDIHRLEHFFKAGVS
jgi:hypothetical protein